jgi:hypothetical protein
MPPRHTPGREWNKSGKENAKPGSSEKVSSGVAANMRNALDKNWYSQLKHILTAYPNVTPIQILAHLNSRWCPLNVHAKKKLKQDYYAKWDVNTHLTAFGKHLYNNQTRIEHFGISISDKDKLQFYLEQMYPSNTFNKKEMTD